MIKLFITDVDGTLTDGKITYDQKGNVYKTFCIRDVVGFGLLNEKSIQIAIATSEEKKEALDIVKQRFENLPRVKIDHYLFKGEHHKHKVDAIKEILVNYTIMPSEVVFIGDDINDLPTIKFLVEGGGKVFCPRDAHQTVQNFPHCFRTVRNGGDGAVREVIDYILGRIK